jgi:hypothetical protein
MTTVSLRAVCRRSFFAWYNDGRPNQKALHTPAVKMLGGPSVAGFTQNPGCHFLQSVLVNLPPLVRDLFPYAQMRFKRLLEDNLADPSWIPVKRQIFRSPNDAKEGRPTTTCRWAANARTRQACHAQSNIATQDHGNPAERGALNPASFRLIHSGTEAWARLAGV